MDYKKQKLALDLFNLGKIKFGAFKLKLHEKNPDAPLSPIYLNLRDLPDEIYQTIAELIVEDFKNKHEYHQVSCIAGVPNAGNPIADALAKIVKKPVIRLEKIQTPEGRRVAGQNITGETPYSDVIIVDDLITQADTKFEAIVFFKSINLAVRKIYVVVDREQGGREHLEIKGYPVRAIYSLTKDLLPFYVWHKKITREKADETIEYIKKNRV